MQQRYRKKAGIYMFKQVLKQSIIRAKGFPSHFPPQRVGGEFQAAEGEPFLAQVLQRGADMIDGVVDA